MIEIRKLAETDAFDLFPLLFNSSVLKTLSWGGPKDLADHQNYLSRRIQEATQGKRHEFVILLDGKTIGHCGVRLIKSHRAEVGLWIAQPFQNKGIGAEVIRQIKKVARIQLQLRKLEALVFVGNESSRKVFEKEGFLLEGTIRCAFLKNSRHIHAWLFGIELY